MIKNKAGKQRCFPALSLPAPLMLEIKQELMCNFNTNPRKSIKKLSVRVGPIKKA